MERPYILIATSDFERGRDLATRLLPDYELGIDTDVAHVLAVLNHPECSVQAVLVDIPSYAASETLRAVIDASVIHALPVLISSPLPSHWFDAHQVVHEFDAVLMGIRRLVGPVGRLMPPVPAAMTT